MDGEGKGAADAATELELGQDVAAALLARLPGVAERTVAAITDEVPGYAGTLTGQMGENIEAAVQLALGGFLELAARQTGPDAGTPLGPALEGAYALGRGEARSGRSMDALLAAYRVGARVAWREMADAVVGSGLSAGTVARFAELVFAYIDELSAASVAGHADELATTGRVRQRYLERLSHALLSGAPAETALLAAERADWLPPRTLTAVLLSEAQARNALSALDPRTLQPPEDIPGLDPERGAGVLLVPDAHGASRAVLLRALAGTDAVVGPARDWLDVRSSYHRALRARELGVGDDAKPVDTEAFLAELVVGADPDALRDLRSSVLAPLDGLRASTREKLTETLRSWLLHHGRREDVAAELFVHAQTVRYRMGQLRALFGDRLDDPATVLALTIALAPGPSSPA